MGLIVLGACDPGGSNLGTDAVSLESVAFAPNSLMVTAAVGHIECSGPIVALQVTYREPALGLGIGFERTPRFSVTSCPADLNVLGLLPSTEYSTWVTAWGKHGDHHTLRGPTIKTGSLPADLPHITVQTLGGRSNGLTAFGVITPSRTPGYAMIVDSIGRVRWYVADSSHFIVDLEPQPNGSITLSVGTPSPFSPNPSAPNFDFHYSERKMSGNILRRWTTGGYATDNHELRITADGSALLLGLDFRTVDLSASGGSPTAQVVGNVLERVDSTGHVVFLWNAFDHLAVTDIDPSISLGTAVVDWTHSNAVEVDEDGNYLVSSRNLSEVTKIDSHNGNVVWRLGGVRNQFTFIGDAEMFSFQHGIRRLANGDYILFDNGNTHTPPFSRAVEYHLDQEAKTATLVWSYRPRPDVYSFALGFAQRLPNGNTLVTFGIPGTVHEVSNSGRLVWKLTVPAGNWIYRAYRIKSLYEPYMLERP